MAYLESLHRPPCYQCWAKATVQLVSSRGHVTGYYCDKCSQAALEAQQRAESKGS